MSKYIIAQFKEKSKQMALPIIDLYANWQQGVCLSWYEGVAALRQTSTRPAQPNTTQRGVAIKAAAKIRGRAQAFRDPRISLRRRCFSCICAFA